MNREVKMSDTAKKAVPFKFQPRPSQIARTVKRLKALAETPGFEKFFSVDIDEKTKISAVEVVGAEGSFNFAGVCSHCGQAIRLKKIRLEVFVARSDRAPIAFQFGERFCSTSCADAYAQAFIKFGLSLQGLDKKPEKVFVVFEVFAGQNWRDN